jgi:hypothetical protein
MNLKDRCFIADCIWIFWLQVGAVAALKLAWGGSIND